MEKRPGGSKPAAAKKPAAEPLQETETVIHTDSALDAPERSNKAALDSTAMFERQDDDDTNAASMLQNEAEPPRPTHKPAGKPRPAGPKHAQETDDALPSGDTGKPSGASPAGDQTAVFTNVPTDNGGATAVAAGSSTTQAPKPSGATRAPGAGSSGPPSSKVLQKTGALGDYKLLKKLGQGGMGTVYLAQQVSLDRTVALKVLSKDLAAKQAFVQRFQREARLMARLDHPNILRCHDVGAIAGHHYLAMEFVDGGSLQDWLKKLGKFELGDALHVTLACTRALQHAHDLNMVHRDIKPDNLLLTSKGVVKLADLGLAKASDDDLSLTKTGTGAGTPLYMAPEQARDAKNVDHRTDIYAVGCMLYCFLTGQLPFTGETLLEVIDAKTKGKFTPARRLNADIPPRLDLIIDKMLAASPVHRYQSCTELIADLEGLELANVHLSFLGAQAAASKTATPAQPPKSPTQMPAPRSTTPAPISKSPARTEEPAPAVSDSWYIRLPLPGGKTVDKKVSRAELVGLVKDGTLAADTKVCRTLTGSYRTASSHPEISSLIQSMTVKASSDRKSQKYRELYAQIEQDDQQRRRSKWLQNLTSKMGGFIGLLVWLALIAGILGGGVYLVKWLVEKYGG
jgi:serine/threonine-protein kinase